MRLSDLVKGGGQGPEPSRRDKGEARRLSDLVRKGASPEGGLPVVPGAAPEGASGGSGVLGQKEATKGGPPPGDLDAANQALQRAAHILDEILEAVRTRSSFSILDARQAVEVLLECMNAGDALLVPFFSGGGPPPSLAREVANVCILSLKMGMELGYAADARRRLGLVALLADVGKVHVPAQVVGKQGPLTPGERAVVEEHQREGAKLLQKLGPEYQWLALAVEKRYARAAGARQPENEGEEFAAIVHLADVYESLVHHRPFRERVGIFEALKEIFQSQRTTFPDRILKALIRTLSTLPVGSLVRLNTGEIGRVVGKNRNLPLRPVVELLVRRGKRLDSPVVIDLSQSPLHHIQDAVLYEALQ